MGRKPAVPPFLRKPGILGDLVGSGFFHVFQESAALGAEGFTEGPQIEPDEIGKRAIVLGVIPGLLFHPLGITVFADGGAKIFGRCLSVRQPAGRVQYPVVEVVGTVAAAIRQFCGIDTSEDKAQAPAVDLIYDCIQRGKRSRVLPHMGRRYKVDDPGSGLLGNIHQSASFGCIFDEVKVNNKAGFWGFGLRIHSRKQQK